MADDKEVGEVDGQEEGTDTPSADTTKLSKEDEEFVAAFDGGGKEKVSGDRPTEKPVAKQAEAEQQKDDSAPVKSGDKSAKAGADKGFDPYAGLSPAQAEYFKRQDAHLKSQNGRVSSLQRVINEMAKSGVAVGNIELTGDEEWDEFKKNFPDVARIMDTRLQQMAKKLSTKDNSKVENLLLEQEQVELLDIHPDAPEIVQSPEFLSWLQKQPVAVQSMIRSPSHADAAWLIGTYKTAQQKPPSGNAGGGSGILEERQRRIDEAAKTAGATRDAAPTSEAPANEFEVAFNHYADRDSRRAA